MAWYDGWWKEINAKKDKTGCCKEGFGVNWDKMRDDDVMCDKIGLRWERALEQIRLDMLF